MSDPLYDVLKDLLVPGLAGIGGIVVGAGAMLAAFASNKVANQSLGLAHQVRVDEQNRERDAARERYRDQLFRTVEPAVTAVLEHRAVLLREGKLEAQVERLAGATVLVRLELVRAVASPTDFPVAQAFVDAFLESNKTKEAKIVAAVLGDLALTLPGLLSDASKVETLRARAEAMVATAQYSFRMTSSPHSAG